MLQCVAVCCSVLQCVLQCVVLWCHEVVACVRIATCTCKKEMTYIAICLSHAATCYRGAVCCRVLRCVAVCCCVLHCAALCCIMLPCAAVRCRALQRVAVSCSVLQCVAVNHTPFSRCQSAAWRRADQSKTAAASCGQNVSKETFKNATETFK